MIGLANTTTNTITLRKGGVPAKRNKLWSTGTFNGVRDEHYNFIEKLKLQVERNSCNNNIKPLTHAVTRRTFAFCRSASAVFARHIGTPSCYSSDVYGVMVIDRSLLWYQRRTYTDPRRRQLKHHSPGCRPKLKCSLLEDQIAVPLLTNML